MSIQLDYTSMFAKDITPHILKVEKDESDKHIKRAFKFLKEWDHIESVDSEAALIFNVIIKISEAYSLKDMGKVMGELKKTYADTIDFAKAGQIIKNLLNN